MSCVLRGVLLPQEAKTIGALDRVMKGKIKKNWPESRRNCGSTLLRMHGRTRFPLPQVSHELAPFVKRKVPVLQDRPTSSGLDKASLAKTMRLVEKTFSFARGQDAATVRIDSDVRLLS